MKMSFWHRLRHLLLWDRGDVVTVKIDGETWIGFQCRTCGDVGSLTEAFGPSWPESNKRPGYLSVEFDDDPAFIHDRFPPDESRSIRCMACQWKENVHPRELFYDATTLRLGSAYVCPACGGQLEYNTPDGKSPARH